MWCATPHSDCKIMIHSIETSCKANCGADGPSGGSEFDSIKEWNKQRLHCSWDPSIGKRTTLIRERDALTRSSERHCNTVFKKPRLQAVWSRQDMELLQHFRYRWYNMEAPTIEQQQDGTEEEKTTVGSSTTHLAIVRENQKTHATCRSRASALKFGSEHGRPYGTSWITGQVWEFSA